MDKKVTLNGEGTNFNEQLQVGDQLGRVVSAIERAFSVDGGAKRAEVAKADAVSFDERLLDFVFQGVEHGLGVGRTYGGALLDSLGDGVDGDGRRLVGRGVEFHALVQRTFLRYYYILEHRIFFVLRILRQYCQDY